MREIKKFRLLHWVTYAWPSLVFAPHAPQGVCAGMAAMLCRWHGTAESGSESGSPGSEAAAASGVSFCVHFAILVVNHGISNTIVLETP